MARTPDELPDPVVVLIENDFTSLPEEERSRLTQEWLDSLKTDEPLKLRVTGAQMVAEARAEMGW